jgi:hypothetical protein
MAEYFGSKDVAEEFIRRWYFSDGKPPVFFDKIFNNGEEKWIVNYDSRQSPWDSPYIKVLETTLGRYPQSSGCLGGPWRKSVLSALRKSMLPPTQNQERTSLARGLSTDFFLG